MLIDTNTDFCSLLSTPTATTSYALPTNNRYFQFFLVPMVTGYRMRYRLMGWLEGI